jgi:hypothetical protein
MAGVEQGPDQHRTGLPDELFCPFHFALSVSDQFARSAPHQEIGMHNAGKTLGNAGVTFGRHLYGLANGRERICRVAVQALARSARIRGSFSRPALRSRAKLSASDKSAIAEVSRPAMVWETPRQAWA